MPDVTPETVAAWMLEQVEHVGWFEQMSAVDDIEATFGSEYVYQNDRGTMSIDRRVLRAFAKVSEASVVWSRSERNWRLRVPTDPPGRQED
jgi:hypothetical protein